MRLRLVPFELAKWVNSITAPQSLDFSYLASAKTPPTLDLPQIGGPLANFSQIESPKVINLEKSHLIQRPKTFSFPGLITTKAQTEVFVIPALEIPSRDSISLIPVADFLTDNLLLSRAEISREVLLLTHAAVIDHALDDG